MRTRIKMIGMTGRSNVQIEKILEPGRELDALIAEKVMGCDPDGDQCRCKDRDHSDLLQDDGHSPTLKEYSTDISAAWEVVEKLGDYFDIHRQEGCESEVTFARRCNDVDDFPGDDLWVTGYAETVPHAICLAALKAVDSRHN
jgi:hypothetical protein